MKLYITVLILLIIAFAIRKTHRWLKLRKWRKQLERNNKVRFIYAGRWHVGTIQSFSNAGKLCKISYPSPTYPHAQIRMNMPLYTLTPLK